MSEVKCSQCEEVIEFDESYEHNDQIYCESCWNDDSEMCVLCGEYCHYEEFSNIMFVPQGYCGESRWKPRPWADRYEHRPEPGYYALPNYCKADRRKEVIMHGQYTFKKGVFLRPPFGDWIENLKNSDFYEPYENIYMICENCKEKRFNKQKYHRLKVKEEGKQYQACFNTGVYYYFLSHGKLRLMPSLGRAVHDCDRVRDGISYARDMEYRRRERRRSLIFSCYHCKEIHQHKYIDGCFVCTNCGKSNYSDEYHLENFKAKKKNYSCEEA
jgi:hypothetical protein